MVRVRTQDPDTLAVLARLGLVPGATVEALARDAGGVRVALGDGSRYLVPMELARILWVDGETRAEEEAC